MSTVSRRGFLERSSAVGGGLVAAGPLGAFSAATASGQEPEQAAVTSAIYGPFERRAGSNGTSLGNGPAR